MLTGSYARRLGEPLVPAGTAPAWLYGPAPFAVPANDRGADPRFVYANRAAQTCFGLSRNDRGLRIAKDGRRFWIERAVIWQLDRDGVTVGQTAAFSAWRDA